MTVIAWVGKQLAWDSRATANDRKYTVKKFRELNDGRVVVVAGIMSNLVPAKRLLDGNGYPEIPQCMADSSCIIVFDGGKVYEYDGMKEAQRVKHKDAWGSGAAYALGAMACGASAQEACAIACRYSSTCGGKINSM